MAENNDIIGLIRFTSIKTNFAINVGVNSILGIVGGMLLMMASNKLEIILIGSVTVFFVITSLYQASKYYLFVKKLFEEVNNDKAN